jgi:hypothetical protein
MKGVFIIFFLLLSFTNPNEFCRVGRVKSSKIIENKDNLVFLKGHFMPDDGSRLAKFKVETSTSIKFGQDESYPVYSYGPFGSACQKYEMGSSPLNAEGSGISNIRYLIAYKDRSDGTKIVTPIFHHYGLVVDLIENRVIDSSGEMTSLKSFENYIRIPGRMTLKWKVVSN